MPNFIDRRLNPKDKSIGNRRRFLKRAQQELKRAVKEHIRSGKIADIEGTHSVPMPSRDTSEPSFRHAPNSGHREYVLPGNKEFSPGDRIAKPPAGGRGGGGDGTPGIGEAEDDFRFVLSREEVLDLFFEDLELPDMVKLSLKEAVRYKPRRAGYTTAGAPNNINVARTMRNSLGRRIALHRPKLSQIEELRTRIEALEAEPSTAARRKQLVTLREELERLERRRRMVAYVDPVDIRYNRFEQQPLPNANAVMFCLMDVSSSMGEREKDLAKRFFVLLHLFLKRRYERIDIVFIRHTHEAKEVDEETFFYSTETGGTIVSTALEEMQRVIRDRYPPDDWNIYAAQASDGDNMSNDNAKSASLLENVILPMCQYFAYIEVAQEHDGGLGGALGAAFGRETDLWRTYKQVAKPGAPMAMRRVKNRREIFPVFRELFARENASA